MVNFLLMSLLLALAAASFVAVPFLRRTATSPPAPKTAAAGTAVLLIASGTLYGLMGNMRWIYQRGASDSISALTRHLAHEPADLDGMPLGRITSRPANILWHCEPIGGPISSRISKALQRSPAWVPRCY